MRVTTPILLLLAASCGDSGEGAGGDGGVVGVGPGRSPPGSAAAGSRPRIGAIDTVAELNAASVELFCDNLFRCALPNDDLLAWVAVFETEARCVEIFGAALDATSVGRRQRALQALESEGRVRVDSAAVQDCLQASGECGPSGSDFACPEVIEGTVPAGGPCRLREECAGDAYCDLSTGTCPGVCTPRQVAGMPCDSSDECSGGSAFGYCDANGEQPAVCAERIFSQARGEGDTCNLSGHAVALCPPGLFCDVPPDDTSDSTLGTCQRAIALGAGCDDADDVCVAGAICHGPDGARTCQEIVRLAPGASCGGLDANDPPSFCDPFEGVRCGPSGTCEALGDGSQGSACDTTDFGDLLPCDPGLYCDYDSETCEPLRPAGTACDSDRSCMSGSCDYESESCREEYCDG